MKYAQPGATFDADADNLPTGLAGTLGVQILNGDGTVQTARVTAGIAEAPAGSGHYVVALTAPSTADDYTLAWDDGSGNWAFETLVVTYTLPTVVSSGTGLIVTADLDNRGVDYEDAAQAAAAIDDASAVARDYTSPIFDTVSRGDSPDVPGAVVAVVVGMVRRVLTNPRGLAAETLGDYAFQAGANSVATLLPTDRERRMLRRAAVAFIKANGTVDPLTGLIDIPTWGASAPYQQVDLPAPPAYWDGIKLPSDDYINP